MTSRFHTGVLVVLIAFLTYLTYLVLRPFFSPLMWAAVFAIVFYPIYDFVRRKIKVAWLAALLSVALVLLAIVGPLSYMLYLIAGELQKISFEQFTPQYVGEAYRGSAFQSLLNRALSLVGIDEQQAFSYIMNAVRSVSKQVVQYVSAELANIAGALVNFFIMAFLLFFFFKNGRTYLAEFVEFLPFSPGTTSRLTKQVKDIVASTIYGGVAVAVAQGLVGATGFVIVGISSPLLWGLATAITSFIPFVGAHIVWVPIAIYLLATGHVVKAIVLALIGIVGIGLVDNVVRPLFIKGRARMSFLLTFLSVFGGIGAFGLLGIVLGPLVLALFLSVMHIAKDYEKKEVAHAEDGR